jgi:hypothetical protein
MQYRNAVPGNTIAAPGTQVVTRNVPLIRHFYGWRDGGVMREQVLVNMYLIARRL